MRKLISDFEHTPKVLKWTIIISFALFFMSLKYPAFFIDRKDNPGAWSNSLELLLMGWSCPLRGAIVPFIIWLANPMYFSSIILTIKGKVKGLFLSLCS